jgi:hypothetical protein
MADIPVNVEINLGVNKQSLGQVKRLVNQEIGNVLAEIAVGVDVSKIKKDLTSALNSIQTKIDLISVDPSAVKEARKFMQAELGTIKLTDITVAKTKVKEIRKQIREAVGVLKIQDLSVTDGAITNLKGKIETATQVVINQAELSSTAVTNLRKQIDTAVEGTQINNLTFAPNAMTKLRGTVESSLDNISITIKANVQEFQANVITPTMRSIGAFTTSAAKLGDVMNSLASETAARIREFESALSAGETTLRSNVALQKIYADALSFAIKTQQRATELNAALATSADKFAKSLTSSISESERLAQAFAKLSQEVEPPAGSLGAPSSKPSAVSSPVSAAANAVSQAIVKEVKSVGPTITAEMAKEFSKLNLGSNSLFPSRPEFSLRHSGLTIPPDILGPSPQSSANKVEALRILNALGAGGGGGGRTPPPNPPASGGPPSSGNPNEDAQLQALEKQIAEQAAMIAKLTQMFSQLTASVSQVSAAVQKTVQQVQQLPTAAAQTVKQQLSVEQQLRELYSSYDRQKAVVDRTLQNLAAQGVSQSLIDRLSKQSAELESKLRDVRAKLLKEIEKNQQDQSVVRMTGEQIVNLQKEIYDEERRINELAKKRREAAYQALRAGAQQANTASRVRTGDEQRQTIKDNVRYAAQLADEQAANTKELSALRQSERELTRAYRAGATFSENLRNEQDKLVRILAVSSNQEQQVRASRERLKQSLNNASLSVKEIERIRADIQAIDRFLAQLKSTRDRLEAVSEASLIQSRNQETAAQALADMRVRINSLSDSQKNLQNAQDALTKALGNQIAQLNKTPTVPRVNKKDVDKAFFGGDDPDDPNGPLSSGRLQTEQLIIRTNAQLAANKLKEVRAGNDYAQNINQLITAQNDELSHKKRLKALNDNLENVTARNIVETQRSIAALSSRKPFAGNIASEKFEKNLSVLGPRADIQTQARFVELLQQQGITADRVNKAFKSHNGIIGKTSELVSNLNIQFTAGQKAAFEFGKAAASAAQRFAAWAIPAAVIFRTLSILQEATQNIVKLDTEATRLAFFNPNFFTATADNADRFALTITRVNESLKQIVESAKATGLSISQTSEAFIEIARAGVGQQFGTDAESTFRDAVTSLVQVEAGALSSAEAVVKLNAIINQFNMNPLQDAKLVAAQLFQEAQRSAFSVGELADAVARVGSAFAGIQNLRFDQVLGLIGQGATTTGASVSRLATALRQLATLAAQNAEELKNFGVSVSTSEGQLTGFNDVLNVLERINQLSGTVFQRQLASLVADRRNIADIIALARNVGTLRKAVKQNAQEGEVAADASEAVRQLQLAQAAAAETLTQKLERLKTSIVELVEKTGIRDFFSGFLDFTRRLAGNAQALIPIIGSLGSILKAIAVFNIARLGGSFLRGAVTERLSNRIQLQGTVATEEAIRSQRTGDAITHALDAQLISRKKAAALDAANIQNLARRAQLESQIRQTTEDIEKTHTAVKDRIISQADAQKQINNLTNQRRRAIEGVVETQLREKSLQTAVNAEVAKGVALQNSYLGKLQALKPALLSAAAVATLFTVDTVSKSFTKVNEEAAKALKPIDIGLEVGSGILKGIVAGAVTGGAFGSVPGAIAGGVVGGIGGGLSAGLDASAKNEEISKELDRQRKIAQDANQASERQIELIRLQSAVNSRIAKDQDAAATRQVALQTEIQTLQVRINEVGEERAEQLGLLGDLQEAQKRAILVQEQLAIREAERTKERVALEEDLVRIRERSKQIQSALGVVEEARISAFERAGDAVSVAQIKIKFNREQIAREIKTAQEEANRLTIAIARLEREPGRDQEEKRLAADKARAEEAIFGLRVRLIGEELRGQKDLLRASEESARRMAEGVRNVSGQIANALSGVVQEQTKIASIISRSGDTSLEALRVEFERQQAQLSSLGLSEESLAKKLSQAQARIAQASFNEIKKNAESQLSSLRNVPFAPIEDLGAEVSRLSELFADVNAGLGLFGTEVTEAQRTAAEQANQEISNFKIRIEQEKAALAVRRQAIQREIQVINSVISAKQREADAIQKRIEKEAEIGKEFLRTPDKIVSELRSVVQARNLLSTVKETNPESFIQVLEKRIRSAQSAGLPGNALLNQVLNGLEAAEKFNIRLAASFSPQQLTSAFARLIGNGAGKVTSDNANSKTIQEQINQMRLDIVDKLNQQLNNDTNEIGLVNASSQLASQQATVLSGLMERLNTKFTKDDEERSKNLGALQALEEKIKNFGNDIPKITRGLNTLQFTTGDHAIVDAITQTTETLKFLVQASPEAKRLQEQAVKEAQPGNILTSFLDEVSGLSGGQLTPFLSEFIDNQLKTNGTLNKIGNEFIKAIGVTRDDIVREAKTTGITEGEALRRQIASKFLTSDQRNEAVSKLGSDLQKVLLENLIREANEARQEQSQKLSEINRILSNGPVSGDGRVRQSLINALPKEIGEQVSERAASASRATDELIDNTVRTFRDARQSEGIKARLGNIINILGDGIVPLIASKLGLKPGRGLGFGEAQVRTLTESEDFFRARQLLNEIESKNADEAEGLRKRLQATQPEIAGLISLFEEMRRISPELATQLASSNSAIIGIREELTKFVDLTSRREVLRLSGNLETRRFEANAVTQQERIFSDALSGRDTRANAQLFDFINSAGLVSRRVFGGRVSETDIVSELLTDSTAFLSALQDQLKNGDRGQQSIARELLQATAILQNSPLFQSGGGASLLALLERARSTPDATPVDVSRFDPVTRRIINDFFAGKTPAALPAPEKAADARRKEQEEKIRSSANDDLINKINESNGVQKENLAASKGTKDAIEKNTEALNRFITKDSEKRVVVQRDTAPVQIAQEAIQLLNTTISESITNSISSFGETISRLESILANNQVNVEFGDFNVKLFAEIIAKIEDAGFADALREKLAGTALESQVDDIVLAITDVIKAMESTTPPLLAARTEAIDSLLAGKPDKPKAKSDRKR